MLRQRFSRSAHLALPAAVLVVAWALGLARGTALAQAGRGYSDSSGYWRYSGGYWYHYKSPVHGYDPGYYASPDRVLPHGVSPGPHSAYPSSPTGPGYSYRWPTPPPSGPRAKRPPTAQPVRMAVRVPTRAKIWINGAKTKQTGRVCQFVSPPLAPGRDYTYTVRASWREGGRKVTRTRRITVRAGEQVSVAFRAGSARKDQTRKHASKVSRP